MLCGPLYSLKRLLRRLAEHAPCFQIVLVLEDSFELVRCFHHSHAPIAVIDGLYDLLKHMHGYASDAARLSTC